MRRAMFCLAMAAFAGAAAARADDKPGDDLVARAKAAAGDKPFGLIVRIKVKPADAQKFEAAAVRAITATRKEPGNLGYELHRDLNEGGTYFLVEKWRHASALEEHLKTDYVKSLLATIGEASAEPPQIHFTAAVAEPAGRTR